MRPLWDHPLPGVPQKTKSGWICASHGEVPTSGTARRAPRLITTSGTTTTRYYNDGYDDGYDDGYEQDLREQHEVEMELRGPGLPRVTERSEWLGPECVPGTF